MMRGNLHVLLFQFSSKGSFICTMQTERKTEREGIKWRETNEQRPAPMAQWLCHWLMGW